MNHRVIQFSSPCFLSLKHGALQIQLNDEDQLIPFEDIGVIVLDHREISLTAQLASRVAELNIALVFVGSNHHPAGILQPLEGNSIHAETLRLQVQCSSPKAKRLWQQIVVAKIRAQTSHLAHQNRPSKKVAILTDRVLSGDPQNVEGQAAALYWPRLFGKSFYRDQDGTGTNAMLNYGYAILRAMVARALTGAGLHPALGIHHHNRYNAFALADDAMEPLRPLVDSIVFEWLKENKEPDKLTPETKRFLLQLTVLPVTFAGKSQTILEALELYAASLRRGICAETRKLQIPEPIWSAVTDKCGSW